MAANELKQEVCRLLEESACVQNPSTISISAFPPSSPTKATTNAAATSASSFTTLRQPTQATGAGRSAALAQVVCRALFSDDFGPRPREWLANLVASIEQQSPGLVPELRQHASPTFADRVLGVVHRIEPKTVLQRVALAVTGAVEQHRGISEQFALYHELTQQQAARSYNQLDHMLAHVQVQVLHYEHHIPQQFAAYLQLAVDACVLLRFATNLLLLHVSEWKTRQRRLANRAETRERRQARGQHVKTSAEMLVALAALAADVETLGALLHAMLNEARQMQTEAPTQFQMSPADRQALDRLHETPLQMVTLLAAHTLVMYNQPLQVLKKLNRFSASLLWLAGPLLNQFGVNPLLLRLRARLVAGRASDGEPCSPQLQPRDPNDQSAAFLVDPQPVAFAAPNASRGGRRVSVSAAPQRDAFAAAAGGSRKGLVAKFVRLRWSRRERSSRSRKASKPSDDAMEEDDEENDSSPNDSVSAVTSSKTGSSKMRTPSGGGGEEPQRLCVTDRLHFLLVESDPFAMPDGTQVQLQEVSFPIVLIVNLNQECQAMFTILWRNAFGNVDEASWPAFQQEVSALFQSKTTIAKRSDGSPSAAAPMGHSNVTAGRGLPDEQLEYLRQRFVNNKQMANGVGSVRLHELKNNKLSEQLRKSDPTSIRQFTLAEYFYSAVKLISQNEITKALWVQQVIWGFISKEAARELLLRHSAKQSAMLVRFSEKQPGAVSVVRYRPPVSVDVVEPWDSKALEKEALIDRLFAKAMSLPLLVSPALSAPSTPTGCAPSAAFPAACDAPVAASPQTSLCERDSLATLKSINNGELPLSFLRFTPDGYVEDEDKQHSGWNHTALLRSRRWEQGVDIIYDCN